MKIIALVLSTIVWAASAGAAQPTNFQHIVVIVQENRTPDNLFYALCAVKPCSTKPDSSKYDIQKSNWRDKHAQGGTIEPTPVPLVTAYGPRHAHADFVDMCDLKPKTSTCRMDGAGDIPCQNCPPDTAFKYVDNSTGVLDPYIFLATHYGWANDMFQTNQGPSFPAHQFLFGATSAPSAPDDHKGIFAAENLKHNDRINGCIAPPAGRVQLINAKGTENPKRQIYPCFEHATLADLLHRQSVTWRYYTPGAGDLWSAPDAIKHICVPRNGQCTGPIWLKHMALNPLDVLQDVANCKLPGVSWVIPSAQFSDHAGIDFGGGPAWVAKVVNAVGNSPCRNADNSSYWDSTAILITWDDWGGWYDHERPTFLPYPEGGYQYGFRVPFLFASAYTPKGYINNEQEDFGSIVRFIEFNFGIPMGELTFADARSTRNLARFYDLAMQPRTFETIPAPDFTFAHHPDRLKLEAPDDD
ncbi:MAG TPA: alkaline phosphatase family protein [Rhizomicrobium sp.]|jgi:phospholipase C